MKLVIKKELRPNKLYLIEITDTEHNNGEEIIVRNEGKYAKLTHYVS